MAELVGDLSLETSDAENQIGDLGSALDAVAESFGADLTDALSDLSVSDVDTAELEAALTDAADTMLTELQDVLDQVGADGVTLDVDANTDAAVDAIDGLVADPLEVPVDADITDAQEAIDSLEADAVSIDVDADTSEAQASFEGLNDDAGDAAGGLTELNTATDDTSRSMTGASGAAATMGAGFSGAGSKALGASLGILTLGVGLGELVQNGIESAGTMQRFTDITGKFGDSIQAINVGNLRRDLSELAIDLGSDDEAALDAAASIFQFGKNSGATGKAAASLSEDFIALAARAVAITPSLGDVGSVAEAMVQRLGKGGKAATRFGIDLRAADIEQEAFKETGKTLTSELTQYDRAQAAATLAVKKYGDQLDESITRGAKNPILQQRKLREELNNVIEAAGQKLVPVFFDLLKAAIPVVETMTHLLADLGTSVLPPLADGLRLVAVPLQIVGDILDLLPDSVIGAAAAVVIFQAAIGGLGTGLGKLSTGLGQAVSNNALRAGAAIAGVAIGAQALNKVANPDTADGILDFALAGAALGTAIEPGAGTAIGAVAGAMVALGTKAIAAGLGIHDLTEALKEEDKGAKAVAKGGIKDVSAAFERYLGTVEKASQGTGATKITTTLRAFRNVAEESVGTASRLREEFASQPAVYRAMGNIIDQTSEKQRQLADDNLRTQQTLAAMGPTATQVAQAVDQFGQSVASVGPTSADAFDKAQEALSNFGVSLAQAPEAFGASLDAQLAEALQFSQDLKTILGAGAESIAALLATKGAEAAGGFTHTLAEQIRAGDPSLTTSFESKAEQLALAGQLLEQTGTTIGEKFVSSVGGPLDTTSLPKLEAFLSGIGTAAEQQAPLVEQQLAAVAGAAALGFSGPISKDVPAAASTAVSDAATSVTTAAPGVAKAAETAGQTATKSFAAGLEHFPDGVDSAVAAAGVELVVASISLSFAAFGAGSAVGSTFSQGVASGIASSSGAVRAAARGVIEEAEEAARKAADAHSPSRLMAKLGEDIGDGLVRGIEDSTDDVRRAMADLIAIPNETPVTLRAVAVPPDTSPALTLRGATAAAVAVPAGSSSKDVRIDHLTINVDGSKVTSRREAQRLGDVQGASVRRRVLETLKELQ